MTAGKLHVFACRETTPKLREWTISMNDALAEAPHRHLRQICSLYVFFNNNVERDVLGNIRATLRFACKRAGIKGQP